MYPIAALKVNVCIQVQLCTSTVQIRLTYPRAGSKILGSLQKDPWFSGPCFTFTTGSSEHGGELKNAACVARFSYRVVPLNCSEALPSTGEEFLLVSLLAANTVANYGTAVTNTVATSATTTRPTTTSKLLPCS